MDLQALDVAKKLMQVLEDVDDLRASSALEIATILAAERCSLKLQTQSWEREQAYERKLAKASA